MERVRELTYDQRATWGECPICKASDGQWCDSNKGIPLGFTASGELPPSGVHLGRLYRAPFRVREVAVA